ncbi:MAG: hypothetical protein ABR567_07550 [Myxococcales bacterium]|nr:hypothetical protein [Myxococcales bacterium]
MDARKYYPLAIGNSWTYAESRSGKRETIKIVGQDGPWFLDDHGGRLRYETDGVRDADRYLLRTPLAAGAKWSAVENLVVQRFEVVATGAQSGRFTGCVVVHNEQPIQKGGKFVTEWTYAPKVGLVEIATSTIDARGNQQPQTKLQLLDYKVQ